ncbi:unnamed protein product [Vitrella brassicaformis CCMP3155]|uniref:Potassium channel tetramerisation-type BTB domain-containing protein n=1 Tax=Vitrella brassicaformis (strain CCMP3155) TaxID=1169540 RepID=A0A0G4EBH8_VITBC|nr:unnamed protein product [Vitrella brassicaformis CCMP3155]|eukprot:CEL93325.1 unnamed protein product [Vitrella brassicaformis CCMP3155]
MTSFVRLNVGGREFSVAISTLLRHPDTLLGQLVTNQSTAEYQQVQQGQPVFIDADPSLFPYVIDYYRHGTPLFIDGNTDTRRLMREMRYFGLNISDSETDLQRPPPSEEQRASRRDEVMRRVAVKMARTLLLLAKFPVNGGSTCGEIGMTRVKSMLDDICDWVGPEAAEIKRFSSSGNEILMLLGEVWNEMQISLQGSGRPFYCSLERVQEGGLTKLAFTIDRI